MTRQGQLIVCSPAAAKVSLATSPTLALSPPELAKCCPYPTGALMLLSVQLPRPSGFRSLSTHSSCCLSRCCDCPAACCQGQYACC